MHTVTQKKKHMHSLIRIFTCPFWIAEDAKFLHADNKTERTGQLRMVFWVFIVRLCQKVHFLSFSIIVAHLIAVYQGSKNCWCFGLKPTFRDLDRIYHTEISDVFHTNTNKNCAQFCDVYYAAILAQKEKQTSLRLLGMSYARS